MPRTTEFLIEEIPLLTIDGVDTAYLLSGGAEISYDSDGKWGIEAIWLDGYRKTTAAEREKNPKLGREEPREVVLPKTHPIYQLIACRLEGTWREYVQQRVREALQVDHDSAMDNRRDAIRDDAAFDRAMGW